MPYLLPRPSTTKHAHAWSLVAAEHTGSLAKRLSAIARRVAAYVRVLADYYAATATYEQLSRLSDTELARRGLSRASLARDVLAACERRPRGPA